MTTGYRRPVDPDALATNLDVFAEADCATEPLYASLSHAVAGQPRTLDLLKEAPYAQRRPVLLYAAVHDLLLAGATYPLAAFYRTVARADARRDVEQAAAPFADLCQVERAGLLDRLRHRATQTNEVGRSADCASR